MRKKLLHLFGSCSCSGLSSKVMIFLNCMSNLTAISANKLFQLFVQITYSDGRGSG